MKGVRFAPSPTGRFHVGNLRTAWISAGWAKTLKQPWVVRFEDIDAPRVVRGAQDEQLSDLARLGLTPDAILIQSQHHALHEQWFTRAREAGQVYPCTCSRKDLQEALAQIASAPHAQSPTYSGICRQAPPSEDHIQKTETLAWRFKMPDPSGTQDFVVARTAKSGFTPGYHWACAVDDWEGGYRLLVRASDLASSLPLQRAIQSWLNQVSGDERPFSAVFHAALITQDDGHRLEKRTPGVTLDELVARGITEKALLKKFETSFRSGTKVIQPEAVLGEEKESLRLADLGI